MRRMAIGGGMCSQGGCLGGGQKKEWRVDGWVHGRLITMGALIGRK